MHDIDLVSPPSLMLRSWTITPTHYLRPEWRMSIEVPVGRIGDWRC
jgi:hypothetical protein